MKVDKSVQITGMVVVGMIIITLIIASGFLRVLPTETISANGVSSVYVTPDLVEINFNVETKGLSANVAKDENAKIVDAVVVALMAEGFAREDIETQNFNVYEDFDYGNEGRTSVGFKAMHSLKVEISSEDSGKIGGAIDAGVDNGALLGYINFKLSGDLENEYKAEALALATADARVKAGAMASGLGENLGRGVSVSSGNFGYSPWMAYAEVGEMAVSGAKIATDIEVGEREVTGRVTVVYKLR
jgi:uncharacterized protein